MVCIFEIDLAGKYDAKLVIKSEKIKITKTDKKFISLGILSKKYTSGGKIFKSKVEDKKTLIFSIYKEKTIPMMMPEIVANNPIKNPVKKKRLFY